MPRPNRGLAEAPGTCRDFRFILASRSASSWLAAYPPSALYYPPCTLEDKAAQMDAVTADDVLTAARRIFRPENLTTVVVGSLTRARQAEVRAAVSGFR